MGEVKLHKPVKLIIGFIFKEIDYFEKAKEELINNFGEIDFESDLLLFSHTTYYEEELGKSLKRKILSFSKLVSPEMLPDIKIATNEIEKNISRIENGKIKRDINIDPGYVDENKLILATTKNYTHRIYLRNGIFAEITLYFKNRTFNAWEWTYPDYRSEEYINIFNKIREMYKNQINLNRWD